MPLFLMDQYRTNLIRKFKKYVSNVGHQNYVVGSGF